MPVESFHSDKELLCKISKGDELAFQQLFNRYWPQVYGTCLHLTRSPEQSKDLSQDIFMKMWDNRFKLTEVKKLDSYLYTVSRNLIFDHLRKKVFDPSNIDFLINYFQSTAVTGQEKIEYKELENTILDAVKRLPGKVQDVFRLSRFEGLTHEQIAAKLNISIVSSKTYIVRALKEIRSYLATHCDKIFVLILILLIKTSG